MTSDAVLVARLFLLCFGVWLALFLSLGQVQRAMFKAFFDSAFGRSVVAAFVGGLAPAVPALVMGDVHTFRIAVSASLGATATVIALHFKASKQDAKQDGAQ